MHLQMKKKYDLNQVWIHSKDSRYKMAHQYLNPHFQRCGKKKPNSVLKRRKKLRKVPSKLSAESYSENETTIVKVQLF